MSSTKAMCRGEVSPVMRPTSRSVSASTAKITFEVLTTIHPMPSRRVIDCPTSPSLNPLARRKQSFSARRVAGS